MFWRQWTKREFDVASDGELINALSHDNQAAFTAFYNRYSKLIYYVIQNIEKELADDIFQEFFVWLQHTRFRALRLWKRQRPLPSFLRQVVRNFTLDKLRKERSKQRHNGSDELERLEVESADVPAQATIELRDMRKGAIRAWAQLPSPRDRRLICGKYHRDTPFSVGAERERLSQGAYRKAVFDAQRRFMALVKLSLPEYFS